MYAGVVLCVDPCANFPPDQGCRCYEYGHGLDITCQAVRDEDIGHIRSSFGLIDPDVVIDSFFLEMTKEPLDIPADLINGKQIRQIFVKGPLEVPYVSIHPDAFRSSEGHTEVFGLDQMNLNTSQLSVLTNFTQLRVLQLVGDVTGFFESMPLLPALVYAEMKTCQGMNRWPLPVDKTPNLIETAIFETWDLRPFYWANQVNSLNEFRQNENGIWKPHTV